MSALAGGLLLLGIMLLFFAVLSLAVAWLMRTDTNTYTHHEQKKDKT